MPMNNRLLRPRASGGFLPTSISNLYAWFDASQTSTVTLNGSAPNQTVSEWRDRRSSSTLKLTQTTAGRQPTWIESAQNGLPGVGTPNFTLFEYRRFTSTLTLSQPFTMFLVFRTPGSAVNASFAWDIVKDNLFYGVGGTNFRMNAGSDAMTTTVSSNTYYAAVLTYDGASSSRRLSTKTATTGNPGSNGISNPEIRGNDSVLNEFGFYSKTLSSDDSGKILDYLSKKWSITLS